MLLKLISPTGGTVSNIAKVGKAATTSTMKVCAVFNQPMERLQTTGSYTLVDNKQKSESSSSSFVSAIRAQFNKTNGHPVYPTVNNPSVLGEKIMGVHSPSPRTPDASEMAHLAHQIESAVAAWPPTNSSAQMPTATMDSSALKSLQDRLNLMFPDQNAESLYELPDPVYQNTNALDSSPAPVYEDLAPVYEDLDAALGTSAESLYEKPDPVYQNINVLDSSTEPLYEEIAYLEILPTPNESADPIYENIYDVILEDPELTDTAPAIAESSSYPPPLIFVTTPQKPVAKTATTPYIQLPDVLGESDA